MNINGRLALYFPEDHLNNNRLNKEKETFFKVFS
jgi:hypothetical protein